MAIIDWFGWKVTVSKVNDRVWHSSWPTTYFRLGTGKWFTFTDNFDKHTLFSISCIQINWALALNVFITRRSLPICTIPNPLQTRQCRVAAKPTQPPIKCIKLCMQNRHVTFAVIVFHHFSEPPRAVEEMIFEKKIK